METIGMKYAIINANGYNFYYISISAGRED